MEILTSKKVNEVEEVLDVKTVKKAGDAFMGK